MTNSVYAIAYLVSFIPGIFLFYFLLQGFDWEKTIKPGKAQYFKACYILLCFILSGLLAFIITNTMNELSNLIFQ